ncbi:DUF4328 domain-containing protein [Streptomyces sp. NPDC005813]|uniref:DUF4328 domain-containing protein n=1 Tax=Streptomyces sp. NPDC005813 TaxID=3155592 RepID=UPI0033F3AD3C
MLCTHCRHFEATAGDGLCDICIVATAAPHRPGSARRFAGSQRSGSSQPPAAQLRSPVGLAQATVVMLAVSAAAGLFSLYSVLSAYGLVSDIAAGAFEAVDQDDLDLADRLLVVAGRLQFVLEIATAVVFVCWFHRVRVNAEVFGPQEHRMRRGWAVWGWFVPVVNLWFPRRVAADIWDASAPLPTLSLADGTRMPSSSHLLLNSWWLTWVAAALTDRLSGRSVRSADTPAELREAMGMLGVAEVLWVVAAVLAVLFVRRLTRMQDDKARRGPLVAAAARPAPNHPVP